MQNNLLQLSGVDLVVPTHGLEGAKAYPLGPNCRAPLFDDTEDIFYIKSTDANGFPTVKKYRFEEEVTIDTNNSGNGVALQDIRSMIREELLNVKEELLNAQQSVSTANNKPAQSYEPAKSSVTEFNGNPAGSAAGKHKQRSNSSVVEPNKNKQQPETGV